MKIYIYSKNSNLDHALNEITHYQFEIVLLDSEEELFRHELEKGVLVIDIDSVGDHGFTLATKLAHRLERQALIVGVTTLQLDSSDSKFDFFFNSFRELKENFEEVMELFQTI